jgi:hypothetical protein
MKKPFSLHLYTFSTGVFLLKGQLMSIAGENMSRTREKFIGDIDNIMTRNS